MLNPDVDLFICNLVLKLLFVEFENFLIIGFAKVLDSLDQYRYDTNVEEREPI